MKQEIPSWQEDFIQKFASDFATQRDFVNSLGTPDANSLGGEDEKDSSDEGENLSEQTKDSSGNKYELVIDRSKKDKSKKDEKGTRVQFTSLDMEKNNIAISGYLDSFCRGRYADLKNHSLKEISAFIKKDTDFIVRQAKASIIKHANYIGLSEAKNLTADIANDGVLLSSDYNEVCSKLIEKEKKNYDTYLKKSNIEVRNKSVSSSVNYYLGYIKGMKEYNMITTNANASENMKKLKMRISSVTKSLDDKVKKSLMASFNNDNILKRI